METENALLGRKNYFFKMHGTGNDFILVNGTQNGSLETAQAVKLAEKLCHRKFGIGADGLLIVRKINDVYKMQVVNSDGSLPKMCGNGLRCFVSLLYHLKMIPNDYDVLTDDGSKSVTITELPKRHSNWGKEYMVNLKIGKGQEIEEFISQKYGKIYLTTIGVPHLIIFLAKEQFQTVDFEIQGKQFQKKFDANINFCLIDGIARMIIKTFERGAGMTYSCGTGVSSSVYVATKYEKILSQPVMVETDGGELIIEITEEFDVIMNGPARIICEGTFQV